MHSKGICKNIVEMVCTRKPQIMRTVIFFILFYRHQSNKIRFSKQFDNLELTLKRSKQEPLGTEMLWIYTENNCLVNIDSVHADLYAFTKNSLSFNQTCHFFRISTDFRIFGQSVKEIVEFKSFISTGRICC